MSESLFQRTSSFDNRIDPENTMVVTQTHRDPPRIVGKADGPSSSDLNRWYESLRDICERESDGDVDHSQELEDLKDEIYNYLY
jgi:hypothetical protein